MRILFDKNVPEPLRLFLHHEVQTTDELDWSRLENGDLLNLAEGSGFDLMVTADQNVRYQQNLKSRTIALVVLGSNRWSIVRTHVSEIVAQINASGPNTYVFIEMPLRPKLKGFSPT